MGAGVVEDRRERGRRRLRVVVARQLELPARPSIGDDREVRSDWRLLLRLDSNQHMGRTFSLQQPTEGSGLLGLSEKPAS